VEFRLLGPLEVLDGERPVEIAGSKRRALLALLLLHANEVVRTERLIDDLWGERAPRNASAALHNHVSRLRKALGPEVLARREWGYVLRVEPESIDQHRFEQLIAAAEPLPARERSAKLGDALALWRGPALADLAMESSLQAEAARLDDLRLTTLERRIDADLEAGRNSELVGEIEALIAAHPLREHLRGQLILALYRSGRQAEALEVYRETRRVLTEELGLEPSPALRELERAILRQDPAIASAAPALAKTSPQPTVRSRRTAMLLGPLALLLLGLGIGVPFALIDGTSAHSPAHAQQPISTTSVATTLRAQGATTPHHKAARATRTRKGLSTARHRERRQAAVVAAATSPAPAPPPSPPLTGRVRRNKPVKSGVQTHRTRPKIVTISDDFTGTEIDGTIWYQIHQGTGWSVSDRGGHLEFTFPPGTAPGGQYHVYGGHVGTLCVFPGDFDARVGFTLAQWPASGWVDASLWSFFKPNNEGWEVLRGSSPQWGDRYSGYLGPGSGGSTSLDDLSGRFVSFAGTASSRPTSCTTRNGSASALPTTSTRR
jgi:DNA-binding SARP family transcriptional activator